LLEFFDLTTDFIVVTGRLDWGVASKGSIQETDGLAAVKLRPNHIRERGRKNGHSLE